MDYDVLIVGGGMVGASLGCALAPTGLRVAVLEAVPFGAAEQPSFDERTVALTYGSRRIFEGIGAWDAMAADATAIRSIHVSDRGHFGMTRLDCALVDTEALGYVLAHRAVGRALLERIDRADRVAMWCPAEVASLAVDGERVTAEVVSGSRTHTLGAKLVVIADGGRSRARSQLGIRVTEKPYPAQALVGIVASSREHHGVAYERFTRHGPLALLPVRQRDYALVWSLPAGRAESHRALSEPVFLERLQDGFGDRAGRFVACGRRSIYPLNLGRIQPLIRPRAVVVGNAAHTVHPVAGQGFNLGLRDVAVLAELLADAAANREDIGQRALLSRYAARRRRETRAVAAFTDGLIRVFASDFGPLAAARGLGLVGVALAPPLKRLLLRRTMGLASRPTRLAAGLTLASRSP